MAKVDVIKATDKPIRLVYKHWSGNPIRAFETRLSEHLDREEIYFYFELFYLFVWTRLYNLSLTDEPTIEWEDVRDKFRVWLVELYGKTVYALDFSVDVVDAIESFMDSAIMTLEG